MIDDIPANPVAGIDVLILRIRGLVRVHESLRERGMSEAVLGDHRAEIDRLQARLAEEVRSSLRMNGDTRG